MPQRPGQTPASQKREAGHGKKKMQQKANTEQKHKKGVLRQWHGSGRHRTPSIVESTAMEIKRKRIQPQKRTVKADNMCNPPSGHEVCNDELPTPCVTQP
jgi:hypothetical protein